VAAALYRAFVQAKAPFLDKLSSGAELTDEERVLADRTAFVGPDPIPYGIEANRPTLEAIVRHARSQKILSKDLRVEDMFVPGAEG
jgi:4,5-dihydroxyphthalate decarboxylase